MDIAKSINTARMSVSLYWARFHQKNCTDTQSIASHRCSVYSSPLEHAGVLIPVIVYMLFWYHRPTAKTMVSVICFGGAFPDLVGKSVAYVGSNPVGTCPHAFTPICNSRGYCRSWIRFRTNWLHVGAGFSAISNPIHTSIDSSDQLKTETETDTPAGWPRDWQEEFPSIGQIEM